MIKNNDKAFNNIEQKIVSYEIKSDDLQQKLNFLE